MAAQPLPRLRTVDEIRAEYNAALDHSYTLRFGSPEEKAYRTNVVGPLWRDLCRATAIPLSPMVTPTLEQYEASEFPLEYAAKIAADPKALFKARYGGGR